MSSSAHVLVTPQAYRSRIPGYIQRPHSTPPSHITLGLTHSLQAVIQGLQDPDVPDVRCPDDNDSGVCDVTHCALLEESACCTKCGVDLSENDEHLIGHFCEGITFNEELNLPLVVVFMTPDRTELDCSCHMHSTQQNGNEVSTEFATVKFNMPNTSVNVLSQQVHSHSFVCGDISRADEKIDLDYTCRKTKQSRSNRIPIKMCDMESNKTPTDALPMSVKLGMDYFNGSTTMTTWQTRLSTVEETLSDQEQQLTSCDTGQLHDDNYDITDSTSSSVRTSTETSPKVLEHFKHYDADSDSSFDKRVSPKSKSPPSKSPATRRRRRYGSSLDIEEVKILTSRLNLVTRRPSIHAWQQRHFVNNMPAIHRHQPPVTSQSDSDDDHITTETTWSHDFRDRMNTSLDFLTTELTSMREQDAKLARKLLNIRKDMYKLKLDRSTEKHRMLMDEAMEIEEERDELQQNTDCDLPPEPFSPTLKQCGVTRMNISSRRFSVF